jgi:hypothetical protein
MNELLVGYARAEIFGLYVVPGHGGPAFPGDSSRPRLCWRPSRLTCSFTTGWGQSMGERSASLRTSGFVPPTIAAHQALPTSSRARRLSWCCRCSLTPPWRRIRPGEASTREGPISWGLAEQQLWPAKVLCRTAYASRRWRKTLALTSQPRLPFGSRDRGPVHRFNESDPRLRCSPRAGLWRARASATRRSSMRAAGCCVVTARTWGSSELAPRC